MSTYFFFNVSFYIAWNDTIRITGRKNSNKQLSLWTSIQNLHVREKRKDLYYYGPTKDFCT